MAAYNLYRGNGGRAERVEEHPTKPRPGAQQSRREQPRPGKPMPQPKLPFLGDLPKKLGELETEDFLLILILYLMYRESGDKELLIIMGAMYLL